MFEFKLSFISKSECLLGVFFDQGEYQKRSSGEWLPFTRVRFGALFLTLDFMWYSI